MKATIIHWLYVIFGIEKPIPELKPSKDSKTLGPREFLKMFKRGAK